ncbi:MAG: hypothetical protein KDM81_15640, partial [Verrucomicrobiae bacterium]|nr:hypothetical protein [Verrucomicrobiae bacterium]
MIDSDAAATIRDQIEIITRLQLDLADERRRSACHQQSATRWALVADRYRQQAIMQNAVGGDMTFDPKSDDFPSGGNAHIPPFALSPIIAGDMVAFRQRLIAAAMLTQPPKWFEPVMPPKPQEPPRDLL